MVSVVYDVPVNKRFVLVGESYQLYFKEFTGEETERVAVVLGQTVTWATTGAAGGLVICMVITLLKIGVLQVPELTIRRK